MTADNIYALLNKYGLSKYPSTPCFLDSVSVFAGYSGSGNDVRVSINTRSDFGTVSVKVTDITSGTILFSTERFVSHSKLPLQDLEDILAPPKPVKQIEISAAKEIQPAQKNEQIEQNKAYRCEKSNSKDLFGGLSSSVSTGNYSLVLHNIECVDANGFIFEYYPELHVRNWIASKYDKNHVLVPLTHDFQESVQDFKPGQGKNYQLPDDAFLLSAAAHMNVLATVFKAAVKKEYDGTFTTLDTYFKKFVDSYLFCNKPYELFMTNTVIDAHQGGGNIIHYPKYHHLNYFNNINNNRNTVVHSYSWKKNWKAAHLVPISDCPESFIKDIFGLKDISILFDIAEYCSFNNKCPQAEVGLITPANNSYSNVRFAGKKNIFFLDCLSGFSNSFSGIARRFWVP